MVHMNKFLLVLPFLFLTSNIFGGEIAKEYESLKWNRWTSKNFVVLCLNDSQAEYLHDRLESVRSWTYTRWGLPDIDFSKKCTLICVDDPALFEKMFNLKKTRVEVRQDDEGKITETVIFLLATDRPSNVLPIPLTRVCLAESEQNQGEHYDPWAVRGMASLNGSILQIKTQLLELKPSLDHNEPIFFSKALLEQTPEQYIADSVERRALFDRCATHFCLFVRKEFGQTKYLRFLKASQKDAEAAVKELGFSGFEDFDKTYKRFMIDLSNDLSLGKTPDRYLQIREGSN